MIDFQGKFKIEDHFQMIFCLKDGGQFFDRLGPEVSCQLATSSKKTMVVTNAKFLVTLATTTESQFRALCTKQFMIL